MEGKMFNLTNPGIQYEDQQPQVDPQTGQPAPAQVLPNVKFFKNKAARNSQYLADTEAAVNNTPLTLSDDNSQGPVGAGPAPELGTPNLPKPVDPSFLKMETPNPDTGEPNAAPAGSRTKLGSLLSILGAAARGAAYGAGQPNFGAGFQAAQERPIQMASLRQGVIAQQLQNRLAQGQVATAPLEARAKIAALSQQPRFDGQGKYLGMMNDAQFAQYIKGGQAAQTSATSRENVAGINKRFMPVQCVGLYDTQQKQMVPNTAQGITVTPEIAQDYGLPEDFVGKPLTLAHFNQLESNAAKFAPTVSTTSASINGDKTTTTRKIRPQSNANGITPGYASFGQSPSGRTALPATGQSGAPGATPQSGPGGLHGDDYIKTLPPDVGNLVKGVIDYRVDPQKAVSAWGGGRQKFMQTVLQADPTYDQTQYPARAKLRTDFTSGKGAQNIRSLNTAVSHLQTLSQAVDSLNNTRLPFLNAPVNFLEKNVAGDPRVTNFNNAANAVENEMATVFKGTAGTDQEIKAWRQNLTNSSSPAQLKGGINTLLDLMAGRLGALNDQWTKGMGKPRDFGILSPRSRQILQQLGGNAVLQADSPQGPSPNRQATSGGSAQASQNFKSTAERDKALGVVYAK
jgi:hypothetical protein